MSYITSIGTANPQNKVKQADIAEFMVRAMGLDQNDARKLRALYRVTGIESRYSVIGDYGRKDGFDFYANSPDMEPFPSTKKRLGLYREHSLNISLKAISMCLSKRPEFDKTSLTHLVVVSCTGMYAPGLDIDIIKAMGLSPHIQRLCINFMGCYAAFNGMKLADTFCKAQPEAKVLVVCTELCSLHFQKENSDDNMLANALFADGSAALLVESTPRRGLNLKPESFYCAIAMEGEKDMAWTVGDLGFGDLPGIAIVQPLVRDLSLPAVVNFLLKDPEFVADAITNGRTLQRRQRIEITGSESAKPAVAQARLLLAGQHDVEILT